ncbi:TetR family transcriptional regulator [Aestuariivirga sp.]|uniref:TetR family transcriptional regulator n=1 Tax=Aestuariivirga sp. TaxID=2650926 RepID=UPI0035943242
MNSSAPLPRKASREHRREQLIEATISTIARRGYAQTTLSDVAAAAGVSHGLVNFHFQSKERLLADTLRFMAEEYRHNWETALAEAPKDPGSQLNALILADFNQIVSTPERLAAWCAFWGEAQSRPVYQEQCGASDLDYIRVQESICERLSAEGGYATDAQRAARVLRTTSEGVWLDLMFTTEPYTRDEALNTMYFCASAMFPRHFDENGLIRR